MQQACGDNNTTTGSVYSQLGPPTDHAGISGTWNSDVVDTALAPVSSAVCL
jgi:hypothetical protein